MPAMLSYAGQLLVHHLIGPLPAREGAQNGIAKRQRLNALSTA